MVAIGHSAGGHLACWAAARPGLSKRRARRRAAGAAAGAVAQAGVVDLREAARLRLGGSAVESLLGGSPIKRPARYNLASPFERLPLGVSQLLVHGDADDLVPIAISRRYAEQAAAAGDDCALVEVARCGHFEHLDPDTEAWRAVTEWLQPM